MPPLKRILKRIAIGVGLLVAVLLIVNGVFAWKSERRLNNLISSLHATGKPASLADLAPKPIPDEQNAAVYLARVVPQLIAFEKAQAEFDETPLGKSWEEKERKKKLPDAEELAAMRAIVDADSEILPAVDRAAACENYASQLDYSLPVSKFFDSIINRQGSIRSVGRYVRWKMITLIAEGKPSEAVELGTKVLRITRHYDHEPTLVNYLVSVAVRDGIMVALNTALRQNQIRPEIRNALEAELAQQDNPQLFQNVLQSERAFAIPYAMEQVGQFPAFINWPMRNWFLGELEILDRACKGAMLPWEKIRPRWDAAANHQRQSAEFEGFNEQLLGPAITASLNAEGRRLTLTRCLRILNALGTYRDRTGHEAADIQELSLPTEAVADPWSEKPLRLKMTDQGWLVYSVWKNETDDGGNLNFDKGDWGFAPIGYPQSWE